ncbi:MAG: hypothetical protein JXR96_19890 [Deltaproteobacteria bacterium]|nr:hypothetical protein [Deltaproteobacteria bacterium]
MEARAEKKSLVLVLVALAAVLTCPAAGKKRAPAAEPHRAVLRVAVGDLRLDGERVSAPGPAGFAYSPFFDPALPRLEDALRARKVRRVSIRVSGREKPANERLTTLSLRNLLPELKAAQVASWQLVLDGKPCAEVSILRAKADIEACDLSFGESRSGGVHRVPVRWLAEHPSEKKRRIHLVLDFGGSMPQVCEVLRSVDGDEVDLSIHTGPY